MVSRRVHEFRSVLPTQVRARLRRLGFIDVVVGVAVLALLYLIVTLGRATTVSFTPTQDLTLDTNPAKLPYYALRTLLRMFVALGASLVFTLVYGYVAARSRRAERILIPALDILQSVPVLGFLSITITGFLALFPGSLLGLECAAVFAIFTSQAWNMTFSFYNSLLTVPRELDEASRMMRLSRWLRFWRIEVPHAAIGLVWNGMMSMGAAWFFLVASEAITVSNRSYALPGVGAFAGAAIADGDLGKVGWAIVTMIVLVVGVNALFWRPLVAWSEKFKYEQAPSADVQRSVVLDVLRRSRWPHLLSRARRRLAGPINDVGTRVFGIDTPGDGTASRATADAVFWTVVGGLVAFGGWRLWVYVTEIEGARIFWSPLWQGLVTLGRVVVLVVFATVVWVPVGVAIGLRPRLASMAQPLVQVLASFPANFLFPFATYVFLKTGLGLDLGGIVLMSLGAQWYILFNSIAGAMAIPSDMREAMDNLGVQGRQRWRRLIIPAILPYYVTGGITASGGAWNASIVAEVVTYGSTRLTATGLGAYITEATEQGDYHRILAGIAVMSLYVVAVNRVFWQPLYRLAERRYSL
jgi:NitT/TauT family transport system permease protein